MHKLLHASFVATGKHASSLEVKLAKKNHASEAFMPDVVCGVSAMNLMPQDSSISRSCSSVTGVVLGGARA